MLNKECFYALIGKIGPADPINSYALCVTRLGVGCCKNTASKISLVCQVIFKPLHLWQVGLL